MPPLPQCSLLCAPLCSVARSIPAEGQDSEGALFVFKRLGVEEEEEVRGGGGEGGPGPG